MPPRGGFDASVCRMGYYGAEGLGVGGMSESPYIFYLFLGQLECFRDVDIG